MNWLQRHTIGNVDLHLVLNGNIDTFLNITLSNLHYKILNFRNIIKIAKVFELIEFNFQETNLNTSL